ncbi:tetratricopeptide repeat protein [Kribbella sandramycini]|uniref:DNA-binding SARP family transcriptional activator n=1 Tax=Kribbella sandramycini TaxID=60450 RepID=A0A7Y4P0G2_9ACTN|nr:BTAD domain-containing putative transcriptional regulator [Kribbella sandramycini]MBB6564925.1 DNA-binding SARP family transcriptional activator [Kribbella sandramycini]NOL42621.1 tetratricopeptide repeat protein [Kribbella sandramycini]
MPSGLRIDLLGPLAVRSGPADVSVGPLRQQAMFAVLALNADRVLTPEQLLDLVWDDDPPPSGIKVVPTYVYRIRKALPDDVRLERTTAGYILRLDPGVLDLERFETAIAAAGRVDEPEQALAIHDEALALFRGQPLSGLPGQYLAGQRRRIAERREKALGARIELQLAAGRHVEAIPELIGLVADHPFDERFAVLLMNALAGSGRQAEALDTYQRVRRTLVEQLGIEPGPELRAAQEALLRVDPAPPLVRNELPYGGAAFAGRSTELAQVVTALRPGQGSAPPVLAIDGMAGIGKTTLAVQAGHQLATHYPDGQLFVDLHGHTPGREPLGSEAAIDHLLRGIGVPAEKIPHCLEDRYALWRSRSARLRLLVILDNAPDAETVRKLLPGAPECAVLVTSRRLLVELDAKRRLGLGLLPMEDAVELLTELAGPGRGDQTAVQELAELCGRLPLALRIAGARLRHRPAWTVEHLNQRLQGSRRLRELDGDANGVRTAFAVSYEHLLAEQAQLFSCLGLVPGKDFDAAAAAALAGLAPVDAEQLLDQLVDASLLLELRPGRFEFHDLLRGYAAEVAEPGDGVLRLIEHYLAVGGAELGPAWADLERANLLACLDVAATQEWDDAVVRLALVLAPYLHTRGRLDEIDHVLTAGLAAAARAEDAEREARLLYLQGHIWQFRCGGDKGVTDLRRAAELAPDSAPELQARIFGSLGYTLGTQEPASDHSELLRTSLRLGQLAGDMRVVIETLGRLAALAVRQQEFTRALEYYERALDLARELGDERLEPELLNGIAVCRLAEDEPLPALDATRAAQRLAAEHSLDFSLSYALCHQGEAYRRMGRTKLAVEIHEQALTLAIENCTHLDEIDARLHLARSLRTARQAEAATAQYDLALRLSQDGQHTPGMVEALTGLADCTPDRVRAGRLLRQAHAQAAGSGHAALAARVERRLTPTALPS